MSDNDFNQFLNNNYVVSIMAQEQYALSIILVKYLNTPIDKITPYEVLLYFLWRPSNDKYDISVIMLNNFIEYLTNTFINESYRIVCTIPDGKVWYDSSKTTKNTWINFQNNTINENHNTRACFMDVLLKDGRESSEMKYSASTNQNEFRITFRVGDNRLYPLGIIALSVTTSVII